MKAYLLTVGDEILIGQTIDTNSAWMGQQLNLIGAEVLEIHSVRDDHTAILKGLSETLDQTEVVLMTGGLGPTKDDITKRAIADFFGVDLVFDQDYFERITRIFERFGRPVTENHRLQCFVPANAVLLPNKMGTAPGMWFELEGKVLVSMPGVPYEMQWIMENEVLPRLKNRFPGIPISHRTILTAGVGETQLAETLESFEDNLPPHIKLAYLPSLGQVKLRLTGRGPSLDELDRQLDTLKAQMYALVQEHVYGFETDSLPAILGKLLLEENLWMGTAESCTGGQVAHLMTSVPGASSYFKGSVVAYSNEVKEQVLGVSASTLKDFGAVSEQTVREMVEGLLRVLKLDVAVAISGIAGPDGGTPEKPVGTIWLAVGNATEIRTAKLSLGKDRLKNIEYASIYALEMVRQFIKNQN